MTKDIKELVLSFKTTIPELKRYPENMLISLYKEWESKKQGLTFVEFVLKRECEEEQKFEAEFSKREFIQ